MNLAGKIIEYVVVGAGPACVVGASAPYNHGALLAGDAREQKNDRGYEKLLSGHPHGPLLQNPIFMIGPKSESQI
jgi:hypothetical protein